MLSDSGIRLRRIAPSLHADAPITYAHQDDFYIIGMAEKGEGCGIIDFKEVHISQGDVFIIQPWQVHRFINYNGMEGWMLFADSSFIGREEKRVFDRFRLFASSVKADEHRKNELSLLASMLAGRTDSITDELTKATARRLTETFTGIVAEIVQNNMLQQVRHNRRHVEIVLAFINLLNRYLATNRSPSYYASLLNISPVYLNEVVKKTTGMSATLYIKNELILQAKRLLVHTDMAVKEISNRLGIDDYAYFSRMFTRTAGMSPDTFRRRNLE